MVWQEVTPLLRGNIAVNSLGVPDLKSILERIVVRVCANNPVSEWIDKWGLSIDELIVWSKKNLSYRTEEWIFLILYFLVSSVIRYSVRLISFNE